MPKITERGTVEIEHASVRYAARFEVEGFRRLPWVRVMRGETLEDGVADSALLTARWLLSDLLEQALRRKGRT